MGLFDLKTIIFSLDDVKLSKIVLRECVERFLTFVVLSSQEDAQPVHQDEGKGDGEVLTDGLHGEAAPKGRVLSLQVSGGHSQGGGASIDQSDNHNAEVLLAHNAAKQLGGAAGLSLFPSPPLTLEMA